MDTRELALIHSYLWRVQANNCLWVYQKNIIFEYRNGNQEIGIGREVENTSRSTSRIIKKARLAEMVYETKKKILQGSLTVNNH